MGVPVRCHKCGQTFTVQPTVLTSKPPTTEPIPQTAGAMRLDIAGVTSIGRERSRNEDSFLVQHLTWSELNQNHQLALVIVADGMGGHAGGDESAGAPGSYNELGKVRAAGAPYMDTRVVGPSSLRF
jgi:hypothetical protein